MARERIARLVTGARAATLPYIGADETYGPMGPSASWAPRASFLSDRQVAARRYFRTAAHWYQRALEAVPAHHEARVRLGRTLIDLDRPHDAIAPLSSPGVAECPSPLCALASLFLGAAYDDLDRSAEASRAYLRASSHSSTRQSALAALLRLALVRGDVERAMPLTLQLKDAMPLAGHTEPDAWGVYVGGRRADTDAILGPLRQELER